MGFEYFGWQKQKYLYNTIQQKIVDTLSELKLQVHRCSYTGRTDKGVSALFQYFNFQTDKTIQNTQEFLKILNTNLPFEIYCLDLRKVDLSFNSRYNVKYKSYIYKIVLYDDPKFVEEKYGLKNFLAIQGYDYQLLISKLNSFIVLFNQKANYASYYKPEKGINKNTVLNLQSNYYTHKFPEFVVITLEFKSEYFLRNMIRKIVGMLIAFIEGKVDLEYVKDSIENPDPRKGKYIAPGYPLVLYEAVYN